MRLPRGVPHTLLLRFLVPFSEQMARNQHSHCFFSQDSIEVVSVKSSGRLTADTLLSKQAPGNASPSTRSIDDRRREPRFPCTGAASVRCINPLLTERVSGRVVDVSKHGVRLRTAASFHPGSLLQIFIGKSLLTGEVRYSKPVKNGFEHGVQLEHSDGEIKGSRDARP